MAANRANNETDPVDFAVAWLTERLPKTWAIERQSVLRPDETDASIQVRGDNGAFTTLTVEARNRLEPRDVDRVFGSLVRRLRASSPYLQFLVVAPWLSERTRDLLEAEDVNYVDTTGNARIKLDNPAAFIRTEGASRAPTPAPRGAARVRGPKAGRLIRTLIDISPPYGVGELAATSGLTAGYVSRLLETLDSEALVERGARGRVMSVDVGGLLRRWAESYDVFSSNETTTFLAGNGPNGALSQLPKLTDVGMTAITGSFAAVRLAPVAGPALLAIYCENPAAVATALNLIPTDRGANVALLKPFDGVVWDRTTLEDERRFAAVSQVTVDCLTGNGRMPAEGEALLDWMLAHESDWRRDALPTSETARG